MAEIHFRRDTAFRKQVFVPDSFGHPAKMDAQLLMWLVSKYTEPNETILDPMAGSGTTMLACMFGRHAILVELEEKFCKMCRDNWEMVKMKPQLGCQMGTCQIIQGDARDLEGLLADKEAQNTIKKLDFIFNKKTSFQFSPMSFFAAQHYKGHILIEGNENALHPQIIAHEYAHRITRRRAGKDPHTKTFYAHYKLVCLHLGIEPTYMSTKASINLRQDLNLGERHPDSISNLPYGEIDRCIFSPPYADIEKRDRSKESWWDEEREVKLSGGSAKIAKGYQADSIITSPPYAESIQGSGADAARKRISEGKYKGLRPDVWFSEGNIAESTFGDSYSDNPQNIGNKPYGDIDSIITSPPYDESIGHSGKDSREIYKTKSLALHGGSGYGGRTGSNIGDLKGGTYLEAMLQVYQQCFKVLKDGGLMILVTKNFIRNKQVVRLDTDTIKLCEQAGFNYVERHWRKLPAQSFWRIIYHKKHPEVEQIKYEDILVFRKGGG